MKILRSNNYRSIAASIAVLAVTACGSENSDPTQVSADTDLLVQNAALHASANLGSNIDSIASVTGSSTVTETLTKRRVAKADDLNFKTPKYDDSILQLITPTLEGGNATRTRNGNTITIDPDEQHLCQIWLEGDSATNINDCVSVMADLTVRITASSDDTGTMTYIFTDQNLVSIEYAPTSASYELFLPGLSAFTQRAAEVTGDTNLLPDTMLGAIKLSAELDNATDGEEAGRLSMAITQPLQIASSIDNYDFKLGLSTPFDISANAATEEASVSIAVNDLNITAQNVLGADSPSNTSVDLPNFTLNADLARSGTQVLLSNVGMGRGPFRVAIDNNEIVNIAIAKFSANYNDLTREAEFLQNFDASFVFNYSKAAFGYFADDSSTQMSASIPAGTVLAEQLNGSTKVSSGGPVSYNYTYVDGESAINNIEQSELYTLGQCFDESGSDGGLELVSCE